MRKSYLVAGSALVSLALALTACGSERPSSEPNESDSAAKALFATPEAAGPIDSFTWNLGTGEPASIDWIYSYGDSENTTLANMCESLMRQEEDFTLSPGLAESVDRPDDTTMVLSIRDGVTFWDGSPLTAEDVVYSLERNRDDALGSYWSAPFYDRVKSIEETGDLEVTITFTEPDALFERMLSTAAGVIGQKAFIERAGESYGTAKGGIMCTGPFQFDDWSPGKDITMTRYPEYWNEDGRALADKVTLSFVTDESTITSALVSGDIDGAYRTPLSATNPLEQADGQFYLGASTDWVAIRPTETDGAFQEEDVRRALSMALDRDAIAVGVLQGAADASTSPIQSGAWGYERDMWEDAAEAFAQPEVDVEAASKLIADGDFEGETIKVAYPAELEVESKTAESLVAAGNKIGIDVQPEAIPVSTFTSLYFDAAARADYDAFIVTEYGAGVADPVVSLSEFTPLSAYNYGELDASGVTDNVRSALGTFDDAERAAYLIDAQQALVDSVGLINVVNPRIRMYMGERITGATASLAFLYYPWAAKVGAAS